MRAIFQPRGALLCAAAAVGSLIAGAASAQQGFNPTVLAPASRQTLPQGRIMVEVPHKSGATAPGRKGREAPPHHDQEWHNAIPLHRRHHHDKPFVDDQH